MRALTGLWARVANCAVVVGLLLGAAACGGRAGPGQVTVMVPWSGAEFLAFYSVVKEFQHDTGVHVNVEVTRALTQQLDTAVAAGAPPDLAMLPSVGAVDRYAQNGRLKPLGGTVTKDYAQPLRGLGTVDGTVYAVPVKADVKSLIWYDPSFTAQPPTALPALGALSRGDPHTWCLGLESGATSGWPGADWIADILLAQGGRGPYEDWLSGDLAWREPQVEAAWTTWRDLVGADAGRASSVAFGDTARDMLAGTHRCSLAHGALSALGFPAAGRPGTDYDFAIAPADRPLEVSADFVGRFTDNPAATALISYLSGVRAQKTWVNASGGYAISADSRVKPASYGNSVQRRIAALLQPDSPYTLCFSAADAMSPDMSAAFYRAVLDYTTGERPLKELLEGLDSVQRQDAAQRRSQSPAASDAGSLCATPG